jgi:hypothetical protein
MFLTKQRSDIVDPFYLKSIDRLAKPKPFLLDNVGNDYVIGAKIWWKQSWPLLHSPRCLVLYFLSLIMLQSLCFPGQFDSVSCPPKPLVKQPCLLWESKGQPKS